MEPSIVLSVPQIPVSLNHDGTDGTGIQSVSPVPSASAAGPSVSNSRRKLTNWFANSRKHLTWERVTTNCFVVGLYVFYYMVFTC